MFPICGKLEKRLLFVPGDLAVEVLWPLYSFEYVMRWRGFAAYHFSAVHPGKTTVYTGHMERNTLYRRSTVPFALFLTSCV